MDKIIMIFKLSESNNSSKKVSFNDKVNVKLVETNERNPVVQNFIDEVIY